MTLTTDAPTLPARVRQIVLDTLTLRVAEDALRDADSLYEAGMDSHASVNLMIALESALGIDFPNRLLKRSVFNSIESIAAAVEPLLAR